ncbi:MAG TPA: hypothetical protein VGH11_03565 [Jatrophihabitans sp.]|jgi:hypothetical protein
MIRLLVRGPRLAAVCAAIYLTALLSAPDAAADSAMSTVTMPVSVRDAILAAENDATVAVAVLDTQTGQFYGSAEDEEQFPSESVVKILIAANLLATGQMTGATEQMAYQMITQSDDDDADSLWGAVGGPAVVGWAQTRYAIADLGSPPTQYGWWGNTKFTADGLVQLYAAIKADPVVGPWLIDAMSHMSGTAADGTDQDFGLAAQTTSGAFKQGWGGDDDADDSEQLNSTGLLDGDRYAVAVLVQHIPYEPMSTLVPVIDAVSAAVAPDGQVTATPAAHASTEPSAVSTPTASPSGIAAAPILADPRGAAHPLFGRAADGLVSAGIFLAAGCLIIGAVGRRRRKERDRQAARH